MDITWDPAIALVVAGIGVLALGFIFVVGQPKRTEQGRRLFGFGSRSARREPTLQALNDGEQVALDHQPERSSGSDVDVAAAPGVTTATQKPTPGQREQTDFDKIVSLHVAARDGMQIHGPDLMVAAEKAGLTFGAMNIFHRLVDGRPEQGPVFSVANMVKPGNFDLRALDQLATPGLSFFMTLPGPLSGLDAWDTMLPAAQRMAELLDAVVLDEKRNALGRQRIAHLRDELRAYDRKREGQTIRVGW